MTEGEPGEARRFIWATRGLHWGYAFLSTGGLADPLETYEEAIAPIENQSEGWCRSGGNVALRFQDPDGRRDSSGRLIVHDFVLFGQLADAVDSLDGGRGLIWPVVEAEFDKTWGQPGPPPSTR